MRVRIIQSKGKYVEGDTLEVSKNVAFGLIDSGVAVISKDITKQDIKTKTLDEEQANGDTVKLRSHNKSRR